MYKILSRLLVLLAFFAVDNSSLFAQSNNPIMIIRCRFDAEELVKSSSKIMESDCPPGYISAGEDGGCIPDCGAFYTYNPETGLCECQEECSDYCYDPNGDIITATKSPSKVFVEGEVACNPCLDPQLYLNGICYHPSDCFDGLVDINPVVDCNNVVDGYVPVTLFISGLNEPLEDGEFVSLVDITNCLSADDAFAEYLVLAANSINPGTSQNIGFSFGPALGGVIEISFVAQSGELIEIDLDNGQSFQIETCASDPCSCENLDNIRQGGAVIRFADVLTITDLPPGVSVGLTNNNNPQGFTDASGTPYVTEPLGTVGADGTLTFNFYRASNESVNITYQYPDVNNGNNPILRTYVNGTTCDATTCAIIPTLSQWGLLILGLLISCLSLAFLFNRRKEFA